MIISKTVAFQLAGSTERKSYRASQDSEGSIHYDTAWNLFNFLFSFAVVFIAYCELLQ